MRWEAGRQKLSVALQKASQWGAAAKKAKAPRMRRKFLLTDKAIPVRRDIFL